MNGLVRKRKRRSLWYRIKNGFKAKWNFDNNKIWAIDKDSFEQVGCIHTSQGLEFDYVGVIIGNDLRFENGFVITDPTKRAKSDFSLKELENKLILWQFQMPLFETRIKHC